jgi:hypothetical protein
MTPEQKTPTPRTDAASYFLNMGTEDNPEPHEVVHAERMRVLETELAATLREATKELDRLKAAIAVKDEALRGLSNAVQSIQDWTETHMEEWLDKADQALSSTGPELLERLKKAEDSRDKLGKALE